MDWIDRLERFARSRWTYLLFFGTATVVFSDFVFRGELLHACNDNLYGHFPNLLFGYRAFHAGHLGLWNPYVFCGMDMTESMHHHMLHPSNWPLLLLPEKLLVHGITFKVFLEYALVGCLVLAIARRFLPPIEALSVAVVGQLGGFGWFTVTTLIGTHLLVGALFAIWLICTLERRRPLANFVLFGLVFFDMLAMGHVGYILACGLPVLVAFAWRCWPHCLTRPWRAEYAAVWMAGLCGLVMAGYRIQPVMHALQNEQGAVHHPMPRAPNGYFELTGLVPGVRGVEIADAQAVNGHLYYPLGWHNQFHNWLYLGVVAVFVVYLGTTRFLGDSTRRACAVYLLLGLAAVTAIRPLTDVVNVLLQPVNHGIVLRTGAMFFLGVLAYAMGLRHWSSSREPVDTSRLRGFALFVGVVVLCCLALWARVEESIRGTDVSALSSVHLAAKVAMFVLIVVIVLQYRCGTLDVRTVSRRTTVNMLLFGGVLVLGGVVAGVFGMLLGQTFVLRNLVYASASLVWCVGVAVLARTVRDGAGGGSSQRVPLPAWFTTALLCGAAVVLLCWQVPYGNGPRSAESLEIAAAFAVLRFVVLGSLVVELVVRFSDSGGRRALVPLLTLLAVGDLLTFSRAYSHCGARPFVPVAYPDLQVTPTTEEFARWRRSAAEGNLLVNHALRGDDAGLVGWAKGGADSSVEVVEPGTVRLVNRASDAGTIFQDLVELPPATSYSFGAWVRSDVAGAVKLVFTSSQHGSTSVAHTGSGQWEWLTATIQGDSEAESLRPHVMVEGAGRTDVRGPRVVLGPSVPPLDGPDESEVLETPSLTLARRGPVEERLDLYRVNRPSVYLGYAVVEQTSNLPTVYRLPTYVGVDSAVSSRYTKMLTTLAPEWARRSWQRFGGNGDLDAEGDARLLDVLGARYERTERGLVERPSALPRLGAFSSVETFQSQDELLERLADPSHDPRQTLLLEGIAEVPAGGNTGTPCQPLEYESPRPETIRVRVEARASRFVLFNDSHSEYWTASWNGEAIPLHHANGNFMGVVLPPGAGELELEFRPTTFVYLARLSALLGVVLLLTASYVVVDSVRTRLRRSSATTSGLVSDVPRRQAA